MNLGALMVSQRSGERIANSKLVMGSPDLLNHQRRGPLLDCFGIQEFPGGELPLQARPAPSLRVENACGSSANLAGTAHGEEPCFKCTTHYSTILENPPLAGDGAVCLSLSSTLFKKNSWPIKSRLLM